MRSHTLALKMVALALLVALVAPLAGAFAQTGTILEVAAAQGNFTTLLALIDAAGLTDTLNGAGPFTVFAPTDEAFAALPQSVTDYLGRNPELLASILSYHVVPGALAAADVAAAASLTTVQGEDLTVTVSGDAVKINSADVIAADVSATNGMIHVIDRVVLPTITLPEVTPALLEGDIYTAGSSTVEPVSILMGDLFADEGFSGVVTVEERGTGGGFELFCQQGATDISNASRRIKADELEACRAIGREPIAFYIGIDPLPVVVSTSNTEVMDLTVEQLAQVFSTGALGTWADINPAWGADPIELYSPGTDSGTFDFFVEKVFNKDEEPILNPDTRAQFSENDNTLLEGVAGSENAIGYFGYAYFVSNRDRVRTVAVNGVLPLPETADTYPLTRPLFIYTTAQIMQEKPQVAAFVNYYISNVRNYLVTSLESFDPNTQVGYLPVTLDDTNLNALIWLAAMDGAM